MSFDQDPNEQANISGADLAIICAEMAQLRAELAKSNLQRDTYRDAWQKVAAEIAELRAQEPAGVWETWPGSNAMRAVWHSEYRAKSGDKIYVSPVPAAQAVLEGWPATHLKTGNIYRVTGERTNATNVPVQPGAIMVDYERNGEKFGREASEFQEKFAAAPQPPTEDDGSALLYASEAIAAEKVTR